MIKGVSALGDLVDGNTAPFNYPGENYPNKVYFVNNITGSSTNDGLTWDTAMDQVSTAVTAWEAYRATLATNNQNVRGRIYIQGTGTTYTYITALPNYCDVIGIGADPRGDGAGIVVLGSTGAYDGAAGSMRGTNWYNIQFISGNASTSGFHAAIAYRSGFYNCTFGTGTGATAAPGHGLEITLGSGVTISNCAVVANQSFPLIGFEFADAGGNFSQCLIEDCAIYGSTTGLSNKATLADISLVRNCFIYGGTTGVIDTVAGGSVAAGMWYTGNYVAGGTRAFNVTTYGSPLCIGNYVINGTLANIDTELLGTGATVGYST